MTSVSEIRNIIAKLSHKLQEAKDRRKHNRKLLKKANRELKFKTEAMEFIQQVAVTVQTEIHGKLSNVVTQSLHTVFGDEYTFQIEFKKSAGKSVAEIYLVDVEGNKYVPEDSTGGGVIDVAAFALRLSALMLTKPKHRHILILDEPLKFLSVEFRPTIKYLMEALADRLKTQIIMITHDEELISGKVVQIGNR